MKNFAIFYENKKIKILFLIAALMVISVAALSLVSGSTNISFFSIINSLKNGCEGTKERIFIYVRLPRTLGSIIVGAALSVSGALLQSVLANKLASPSIIGVNSGAGLAVTLCTAFGLIAGWKLSLFSFIGSFVAIMLINFGAKKWGASRGTVILMGVALNSIFNAITDAVITFNPDIAFMSADFKIGDFSAVTYPKLIPAFIIVSIVIIFVFTLSNELDILSLGEDNARGLGMNTQFMQLLFLTLAAILAGCAVSIAGLVSFVGLIIPHTVRRLGASEAKHLLPLCALFGSGFVTLCDILARTLFLPYEIPVGIIMAILGAPFFLFILIKKKGGHRND